MQITLETVRDAVRGPFGRDSFIASFIKNVEASEACPTACIHPDGRMHYNPRFAENYLGTPQTLFCLVVHEMCHCVFRHSTHGTGALENLGEDALINAFITKAFPEASGNGQLFQTFYRPEGTQGLLRPESDLRLSRFGALYHNLYTDDAEITSGEVIRTLRALLPSEEQIESIVLLGSHDEQNDAPDRSVVEGLAEDLSRALDSGEVLGNGGSLVEYFRERIAGAVAIKRAVLRRYTTTRRLDRFVESLRKRRTGVSPVPVSPSKRELIMLDAGIHPPHFRRLVSVEQRNRKGLAVYLDVSGSVHEHLPGILGILSRLEDVLTGIFLFSTEVKEIPFKDLLAGKIHTTYGTSFDCVAKSIVERQFDRAVILTDGYAYMTEENSTALKETKTKILTILYGGATECAELAPFGEVVQLSEVVG